MAGLVEQYKEFLFMAANSKFGIELSSEDILQDLRRLANARSQEPSVKHVQIRRVEGSEELIWLVPTAVEPAKLEIEDEVILATAERME